MARKRNSTTKRKGKKSTATGLDLLHSDMKVLIESSKTQETKFVPEVPDVPRIRFARDRLFNFEIGYSYSVQTSGTAATIGSIIFLLSNCTGYTNLTAVFDKYRIIQANVKLITNSGTAGFIYTVIDYDDGAQLAGQSSFLAYDTLKVTPFGQIDERTLNPRLAAAAYSGNFTSYANMSPMTWIDSASPSVQYYGLKYYIPTSTANSLMAVVTLNVQFVGQRFT